MGRVYKDCHVATNQCEGDFWECQTCEDLYCQFHGHKTSLGENVECPTCEHVRLNKELEEGKSSTKVSISKSFTIPNNDAYAARNWLFEPISELYTKKLDFISVKGVELSEELQSQFYNLDSSSDRYDKILLQPDFGLMLVFTTKYGWNLSDYHNDHFWRSHLTTMSDLFVAIGHMCGQAPEDIN